MNAAHTSAIRRTARRAVSIFAICGIAGSLTFATAPPSFAGPDDAVTLVATEGHVDGPKAYWNSNTNNFELRVEQGDSSELLEDSVNWIGKGSGPTNQYVFKVDDPDNLYIGGVLHQEFLGNSGDLLYWSPQVTEKGAPIWAGFGADAGIPADKLRDGSFSLDIVGWNGPGRYEAFSNQLDPEAGYRRLWSSHTPGLRSAWVRPGSHTHNHSTFSKPGRYEVTYQVTARDLEGRRIASEPQTLVWQVGGTRPNAHGIGDVVDAYNASNGQGLPPSPSLSMKPHQPTGAFPGEQYLTDLIFNTGDESNDGTAVFYIDGYYLAEVPVSGGTAVWPEMVGQGSSQFQVVYIPKDSGSRWISAPLSYAHGQAETTVTELGEFPEENSSDPAPAFDNGDINATSEDVSVTIDTDDDGLYHVTVAPRDDRISVKVATVDISDECQVEFTSTPEQRTAMINSDWCDSSIELVLTPSSRASVGETTITAVADETVNGKFSVTNHPSSPDPDTETEEDNSKPGNSEPEKPPHVVPPKEPPTEPDASTHDQSNIPDEKIELSKGHIDLGPVIYQDKSIRFMLGDDSRQHANQKVYRRPEDVTMLVGDIFKRKLREREVSGPLKFLGKPDDTVYLVPQQQIGSELWPGFSSEHAGGVPYNFEFEPVSAPEGAKWWAFTQLPFGGVQEMLASSDGPSVVERDETIHVHNTWAFTKPGVYEIRMRAVQSNNSDNATEWATVNFKVGTAGNGDAETTTTSSQPTTSTSSTSATTTTQSTQTTTVVPPKGVPADPNPGDKEPSETPEDKLTISQGHIDLGPVIYSDNSVRFMLGDDSKQHAKQKVFRRPEDVIMLVKEKEFRETLTPERLEYFGLPFGASGDSIYLLPETQKGNSLWPGFSSERAGGPAYDFEMAPVSAPQGGKWWAFTKGALGGVGELLGSSDGLSRFERDTPVHLHNNWVFTKPGEYKIKMRALQHGKPTNATDWAVVTFKVGEDNTPGVNKPGGTGNNPQQKPTAEATPGGDTPAGNANTATDASNEKVILSQGHIDLGPVRNNQAVHFMVGDDSKQHVDKKVYRNPENVVFAVGDHQAIRLEQKHIDTIDLPAGRVRPGDTVYLLPETQKANELWPGFSSEHAGGAAYDFEIAPLSTPNGAHWWAFTGNKITGQEKLGSSDGPSRFERAQPVHLHNNWIFTKPGEYTMKMRATEHGRPNNATEWATVTFHVGGQVASTGSTSGAGANRAAGSRPAPAAPAGATAKTGSGSRAAGAANGSGSASKAGAKGAKRTASNNAAQKSNGAKKGTNARSGSSATRPYAQGKSAPSVWEWIARICGMTMSLIGAGLGGFAAWRRFF